MKNITTIMFSTLKASIVDYGRKLLRLSLFTFLGNVAYISVGGNIVIHKILQMLENKTITAEEAKELLNIVKVDNNMINISYNTKAGSYLNLTMPKDTMEKTFDKTKNDIKNTITDKISEEDVFKKIFSLIK